MFKLPFLEVAEDVELLQKNKEKEKKPRSEIDSLLVNLSHSPPWDTCNVSDLLGHQRLAILQVVSLHDGRAVEFGQRMSAPVSGRGGRGQFTNSFFYIYIFLFFCRYGCTCFVW